MKKKRREYVANKILQEIAAGRHYESRNYHYTYDEQHKTVVRVRLIWIDEDFELDFEQWETIKLR